VHYSANTLIFKVRDTGMVIPEGVQKNLFAPFSKGHLMQNEMGSGMGLSIVKDITSKLGGKIEVSSFCRLGTTFTLIFPLVIHSQKKYKKRKTII
jgi:signal transduction histidine kinase